MRGSKKAIPSLRAPRFVPAFGREERLRDGCYLALRTRLICCAPSALEKRIVPGERVVPRDRLRWIPGGGCRAGNIGIWNTRSTGTSYRFPGGFIPFLQSMHSYSVSCRRLVPGSRRRSALIGEWVEVFPCSGMGARFEESNSVTTRSALGSRLRQRGKASRRLLPSPSDQADMLRAFSA